MTAPNLTTARATAASTLVDECTITRDPQQTGDDVWDESTLTYIRATTDDTAVYSGSCRVRPAPRSNQPRPEAGADIYRDQYTARLPASATGVEIGDVLTVTACDSDPALVGRVFTVAAVAAGTWAVTRVVALEARTRGPAL